MRSLVALLLAACGAPDPAASVVWSVYGAAGDPPPVAWHTGHCLPGSPAPTCWAGRYEPFGAAEVIEAARPSESALAHELMHAAQWLGERVTDPEHLRAEWARVGEANDVLRGGGW